jgi:DNA repair photolyase
MKYIDKEFKTAINKLKYPDGWFWCRYTLNPYSGCEHACIYCDARSVRYYLQDVQDFENEVLIKINIDKKLDLKIKRARTMLPDVVAMGGVNDAYQPIELKAENTRKILQVLAKHKYPVSISTKSNLITRDIDLFEKIAKDTWCTIAFSITSIDEELARFLEPNSSTPEKRLEALKKIKQEAPNVQVGINFMPIIPYLCDNDKNLEAVVRKSSESGAEFILFGGLTLRDSQEEFFLKKLRNSKYRDVIQPILDLYHGRTSFKDYQFQLNSKLLSLCRKYNINIRAKRWIPKDYRKWNYKISELLLNKYYIDSLKGKPYKTMLWAGLNLNNLDKSILDVYKRGKLSTLDNFNSKIIEFVEPYLSKSKDLTQKKGLDKFL